jgi:serine protease Do
MSDKNNFPFFKLTRRHRQVLAMGTAATVLVVGLGAFGMLPKMTGLQPVAGEAPMMLAQATPRPANPRVLPSTGTPFSFADLVERVSPAVVTIRGEGVTREGAAGGRSLEDLPAPFRDFFERFGQGQGQQPQQPRRSVSAGSGFIIDRTGFIVTNNHVIDGASKITVVLPDDREFTAKLIGTDAATDVALLKIESKTPLPSVEFGNDRTLRVGDWVVAVGNPFGLSNTVTAGIVSSLGRDVGQNSTYNDFIQLDAPINTGNSGGPTFDLRGQVIGMNSMIFSPSGGSVGIGFAIPATTVQSVVAQLRQGGRVSRGYLGVQVQPVTPEVAAAMGLKEGSKGALVASVVPEGPAAKGGFQQGDLITAINGQSVDDSRDLTQKVALVASGQTATFAVNRQGKALELKVAIGLRPDEARLASNTPAPQSLQVQPSASALGMGLSALTPQARRARQLDDNVSGVVITRIDPDSNAAEQGLQVGDVVLKINNRDVTNAVDVQNGIAEARRQGRKSVLLLVARAQGQTGFVAVEISGT